MVFRVLLLFLLINLVSAFELGEKERTPKYSWEIKQWILDKYSSKDFEKILRDFVLQTRPNRFVGGVGNKNAVEFIVDFIKKHSSIEASVEEFTPDIDYAIGEYQKDFQKEIEGKFPLESKDYKLWDGFTKSMVATLESVRKKVGRNVIWEKKGSKNPDEVIILGANFDTIAHHPENLTVQAGETMQGADNNASGVVVLLALIEVLSQLDLPKTVRVVFFDFEELRFLGTKSYVEKHMGKSSDKMLGYIDLVMLGHDSKRFDKNNRYGNMKLYIRKKEESGYQQDLTFANALVDMGKKFTSQVRFEIMPNSFNSSGHINFWALGIPVVTFSQNWEDDFNKLRYHTANDFVETLNMKTLFNSFKYIAGSVIGQSFEIKR